MPRGEIIVAHLACQEHEVLRESDGNLLVLVEIRETISGQLIHLEAFDPRLEDDA